MVHGEPRRRRDHAGSDIKAGEILQGSRFRAQSYRTESPHTLRHPSAGWGLLRVSGPAGASAWDASLRWHDAIGAN
jgi:hypothetical protein